MPTPSATPAQFRRLQTEHRARLMRLTSATERLIHENWQAIPAQAQRLYAPLLDAYARDLAALRAQDGDTSARLSLSWLTGQQARLQAIERGIRAQVNDFAQGAAQQVTHAQASAAPQGASDAAALGKTALEPVKKAGVHPDALWSRPNPNALANLVGRLSNGKPLSDLFDGFGEEASAAARKALMTGLSMGWGPREIARALLDALGISRNRALVIARQETLGAYRAAASQTYQANSDVLDGWYWSADPSPRTCAMCLAMDGTFHTLDETLDSHVCCRCAMIPKTKSYADILEPLGIDASDIPETSYEPDVTGADWFDQQDAATQQDILGSQAAYDAYADGDLTLSDLIGELDDPVWGHSRYQKSWKQYQQSRK